MAQRGRPPKNRDEEGLDFDNTTISEQEKPASNRGRPKGSSGQTLKKEILADKLNVMVGAVASLLGYEYQFEASDYNKEATALASISNEHKGVAKFLEFLDPLVMIAGIFDKLRRLKKKPKKGNDKAAGQGVNEGNAQNQPVSQPPVNNIHKIFPFGNRASNG